CDDIYGFELERIQASLVVGLFSAGDKQPLPGGTVRLKNVVLNTNTSQVQPEINRFDFPLDLEMSYEINATREGYYPASDQVSTVDLEKTEEFVRRLYLEKIPPPTEVVVTDTITVYDTVTIEKAFVLENILYDFNDDKILPAAEPDLQILLDLLNDTPNLIIELSSHTDYRGTDRLNNGLSQRRANSAKRWLMQRGIGSKRVVAKGYGKKIPQILSKRIADRHEFMAEGDVLTRPYIDSLASEEEMEIAHQINRRTEFKILEGPTFISIPRQEYRKRTILVPPPDRKTEIKNEDGAAKIEIDKRSSLYGQEDVEGLPILVFKERFTDFGMVKQGEKREYVYEVTNKGPVEAKIAVISTCDCTEASEEKSRIKPGETIKINIIFDSTDKEEAEVITMDMFLENKDKEGNPIIERFEYKFDIEK
ncbi:MAG: OmpA family protein, partial [Bacteroidota bacterium]